MIGVITYISVLERKKEIGILRAIGASKRNISQVFNAETFIIGLCAGLIGIGLAASDDSGNLRSTVWRIRRRSVLLFRSSRRLF